MVDINNLTTKEVDKALVEKISRLVLEGEKAGEGKKVSVAFIGSGRMRKLNKQYSSHNKITDVLSFPQAEVPFEKFRIGKLKQTEELGEIVVCLREVQKNSRRHEVSFEQELARVLIHGFLHLLGHDHEKTDKAAKEMAKKEEYYLGEINLS